MSFATTVRKLFAKPYGRLDPRQASELIRDRRAILLDVREPAEWRAGHAPDARHIPLGQLAQRAGELPDGRPVITVCRSGHRSARAAAFLARDGREVFNVAGGMAAWAHAGLPVRASSGPGRVI